MASPVETFILSPAGAVVAALITGGLVMGQSQLIQLAIGALLGYFFVAHLGAAARPV